MSGKKETRPSTKPVPVRFTEDMLEAIDEVAGELDMSRQDVIRLATSAGLKALRKLGRNGLIDRIAKELD